MSSHKNNIRLVAKIREYTKNFPSSLTSQSSAIDFEMGRLVRPNLLQVQPNLADLITKWSRACNIAILSKQHLDGSSTHFSLLGSSSSRHSLPLRFFSGEQTTTVPSPMIRQGQHLGAPRQRQWILRRHFNSSPQRGLTVQRQAMSLQRWDSRSGKMRCLDGCLVREGSGATSKLRQHSAG